MNRYHDWLEDHKLIGGGGDELFLRLFSIQIDTCYKPFVVEYNTTTEKLERIFAHIEGEWEKYGKDETYWSVLTDPNFLKKELNDVALENFYNSGKNDLNRIEITLQRCGEWDTLPKDSCLEYGCGVGRVTFQLSSIFNSVSGIDISPGHIALAGNRLKDLGIKNVSLRTIHKLKDLQSFDKYNFIYSVIVLQHNPPPIIACILRFFFSHLKTNGIVMFQIPVNIKGYKFTVDEYLAKIHAVKGMEMHMLPQNEILRIARENDCCLLEVANDACIGSYSTSISQTFLFKKIL
ncbi:MAG: class I SAM-dependent methyltransferase [Spirochaetaceae bacterium]|nr:class I SAM-dependent methyltransferase [Spirochaetaceae bacterium]